MQISSHFDIFISHSLKDESWVRKLTQQLKNCGLSVFIFEDEIGIGESIPSKINKVLEQCKCVIFAMTPDWVISEWSTHEAYSSLFADPHNRKRKVIPILRKSCEIPFVLKPLRYIDFTNEVKFLENFNFLKSALAELIQENFDKQIYSHQSEQILNQSMLPWTKHGGLSVGFIIPELFIEPKIKAIKNPIASTGINEWLNDYNWDKSIAIVGLPGIGKSTLLKKLFVDYGQYKSKLSLEFTPLFATVRDLIEFQDSAQSSFSEFFLSKLPVKHCGKPKQKFLFLIDGLDEIEDTQSENIIDTIKSIKTKNDLLWISCRKEFFFNRLKANSSFYELLHDVLEIQEWDIEKDSLKFAEEYSKKYKDTNLYKRLIHLRQNSPSVNNFLKNPFELTLILYLLGNVKTVSINAFDCSYTLYKSFYENWLERELFKGTSKLTSTDIRNLHQSVSIALFRNRGNGINITCIDLKGLKINSTHESLKYNSCFWDLLITSTNKSDDVIERFWHETIGEFILAEELIQSFCSSTQSFPQNLQTIYNHEINLFIREGFQQLNTNQKHLVYEKLTKTYFAEFASDRIFEFESINTTTIDSMTIDELVINNTDISVRTREQIIYYLGRLELDFYPPIISFAAKFERNPLLKRSAILGGILHRNEDMEKEYLETLTTGSSVDLLNRSVQLVYFGDAYGDIHTFKDTSVFRWEKTRNAIISRLQHNTNRDMALRWWDLRTLFCFFESRKWRDKISENDFKAIERTVCDSNLYSKNRNESLAQEASNILLQLQNHGCVIRV